MRLTLRTLLAYLDDVLEPSDTKEIGVKIAESPVASGTVARIREVLRRRRITAPELSGPGSGPDPNLVSEYLDNTLSPENVAEVERICLESDVHLAEVAASHQILTLVLGEPVEISPPLRERVYALGAVVAPVEENGHERVRTAAAVDAEAMPAAMDTETSLESRLPEQLRRRKGEWKRWAPAALVLLVLVGWLTLVLTDRAFWPLGSEPAPSEPVAAAPPAPVDRGESAPARPAIAKQGAEAVETAIETPVAGVADSIDPPPPADVPEAVADGSPQPNPVDPDTAVAVVTPLTPAPSGTTPEVAPPAVAPFPSMMYGSIQGVLLQVQPDRSDWTVMPRRSLLHANDWLASPQPFAARLTVPSGVCELTLNGGTRVQLQSPLPGSLVGMIVHRGRIGLYRPNNPDALPEPVVLQVQLDRRSWRLELAEPGTLCGIEALPRSPQGAGRAGAGAEPKPSFDGGLFVVSGSVLVTDDADRQVVLARENGWAAWPEEGTAFRPGPLLVEPEWLTPDGPRQPTYLASLANQYEVAFPTDQPVSASIPALVKDRRARIAELAVQTLALTENVPQLLRALQSEHQEARQAAIAGLREWLVRSPDHGPMLRDEIARFFRDDEVGILNALLWGYAEEDFRNRDVSLQVVEWLAHDDVAVRELAIYQIRTITNRMSDYHPTALPAQRQAAIGRFEDIIRRTGALLPPE